MVVRVASWLREQPLELSRAPLSFPNSRSITTMKFNSLCRPLILLTPLVLGGCAASQLPGYQVAYQGYNVPETLVEKIRAELKQNGLPNARVARDNVGRIRLVGRYKNEDEVDIAYVIVRSIVGRKSTSPFYPEDIQEKRWELDAQRAIERHAAASRSVATAPGTKRALIIGINSFLDQSIGDILGEEDARRVKIDAEKANYVTTALLGSQATKANIEAALARMKQEIQPNDVLLIYISSHGMASTPSPRAPDARKMSIMAYDTKGPSLINAHKTSVSDLKVQELAQMPTRQTRVIIDTCYSGEILKGIPDESTQYILKTNGGVPEREGISMAAWTGPAYSSKGIVFADDQFSRPASSAATANTVSPVQQADLSRYTIVTATSDGQKSWGPDPKSGGTFTLPDYPEKKLKGSFFTQAFFEYLNKYGGQIGPAFAEAQKFTYNFVYKEVKDEKHPGPVYQTPRLNPALPPGDASSLYN